MAYPKLVFMGHQGSGKTTYAKSVVGRTPLQPGEYQPTPGSNLYTYKTNQVNFHLWDISGNPGYEIVLSVAMNGADTIFLFFNALDEEAVDEVTAREALQYHPLKSLKKFLDKINSECPKKPTIVLIGTHMDLVKDPEAIRTKAAQFCTVNDLAGFELVGTQNEQHPEGIYHHTAEGINNAFVEMNCLNKKINFKIKLDGIQKNFTDELTVFLNAVHQKTKEGTSDRKAGVDAHKAFYDAQQTLFLRLRGPNLTKENAQMFINTFTDTCKSHQKVAGNIMGHNWLFKLMEIVLKPIGALLAGIGMVIMGLGKRGIANKEDRSRYSNFFFSFHRTEGEKTLREMAKQAGKTGEDVKTHVEDNMDEDPPPQNQPG